MFNAVSYFQNICNSLNLTRNEFKFCRVTGLDYLEDILENIRTEKAFFAVDDSDDGVTVMKGGAYFDRRAVVVFILKKYDLKKQVDREQKLNECRLIRKKIQSRLIRDSKSIQDLFYLNKDRMPYREVPGYFSAGTCGLYMTITIDEPVNLCYDENDWR